MNTYASKIPCETPLDEGADSVAQRTAATRLLATQAVPSARLVASSGRSSLWLLARSSARRFSAIGPCCRRCGPRVVDARQLVGEGPSSSCSVVLKQASGESNAKVGGRITRAHHLVGDMFGLTLMGVVRTAADGIRFMVIVVNRARALAIHAAVGMPQERSTHRHRPVDCRRGILVHHRLGNDPL
jgi:hypothetical protein